MLSVEKQTNGRLEKSRRASTLTLRPEHIANNREESIS